MCAYPGIEYYRFNCLSKPPSPSENIRKGRMQIRLNDDAANKSGRDRRCAVSILYLQLDLPSAATAAPENVFKFVIK